MLLFLIGCLPEPVNLPEAPQAPVPEQAARAEEVAAPVVTFTQPTRTATSPFVEASSAEVDATRKLLNWVVDGYARDPQDPWAIGHALMVRDADMTLVDGPGAIPYLYEEYAEWYTVGDDKLVGFPRARRQIRVEPHSDLLLKSIVATGVPLDTPIVVQGEATTIDQHLRYSLHRAWVTPEGETGFDSLADAAWALQGLAQVVQPGTTWVAAGNHPMNMDLFTDVVAADLVAQTAFMKQAMEKGTSVEKRRQGIWGYPCGGQHSLTSVAYAVSRGFGSPATRDLVDEQADILYWRVGVELGIYDRMIRENPDYQLLLFEQRLKFLGHFLESAHTMAAIGVHQPDVEQQRILREARQQLIVTIGLLDRGEAFKNLDKMRASDEMFQTYLDFVGDAAHALHGIELSLGAASVIY